MPERNLSTEFWSDPFVESLTMEGQHLLLYLSSNQQGNQAGVYRISLPRIAFEAKIPLDQLPDLLRALSPRVEWYPGENIVWIRDFLKRNAYSPKFLTAAANCLKEIPNVQLVRECVEYNLSLGISIPYPTDRVLEGYGYSTPPNAKANADTKKGVQGETKKRPVPAAKKQYAERVFMTKAEHGKLTERLGEAATARYVEKLSLYKRANGKEYKDDFATVLSWSMKDEEKSVPPAGLAGNAPAGALAAVRASGPGSEA